MRSWGNAMASKRRGIATGAVVAIAMAFAGVAHAASVRCHIIYGGEDFTVDAAPNADPYRIDVRTIGRYFAFKASVVETPARAAAINLYTYSMVSGEPVPIQQIKYRPPYPQGGAPYGFTGLQSVYEATKGSEFQYWCEPLP